MLDTRKRMARSFDLSELIRVRSVYHKSLCKANTTMVCLNVRSPVVPEREIECYCKCSETS